MPKPYPKEFRREVISVARNGEASARQVASDFGISETCLKRWLKIADRDDGINRTRPSTSSSTAGDSAELREARTRIVELEQEVEVMRRAVVYLFRSMSPQ